MSILYQVIFKTIVLVYLLGLGITSIVIASLERHLPNAATLREVQLKVPLKIYTQDGKLLAEYGEKRRTPIHLHQAPQDLINAIIAIEDRRFYQHPGVDLRGLTRAVLKMMQSRNKEQGGSTITMQVARNFFLSREKTFLRKLNEILLALKIEQEFTKNEILELYLNKIYLGKRAYGVAAAAEVYFGTAVESLSLAQSAMIAGLPQAPSTVNPLNSPEAALKRRNQVLARMLYYQFITPEQYQLAIQEENLAHYHARSIEVHAPFVAEMVRQELIETYGEQIYEQGFKVITTIDSHKQKAANLAVNKAILEYDKRHGYRKPTQNIPIGLNFMQHPNWLLAQQILEKMPKFSHLSPAIIVDCGKLTATAAFKDGTSVTIPWQGINWARTKISHYELGPTPKQVSDVINQGDIVYLQQEQRFWSLAQVPEIEGALVSLNANNGAILSLVGGFDFQQSGFNRATQAERQPGSSFKPFIYAAALEQGFTAASLINDAPIVQTDPIAEYDWRPQNDSRTFAGPTRLRIGMTRSRNLVSIRLLKAIGINHAIDFISRFGFAKENLPKGLSLALGSNHLTPLELATGYCSFANGGKKINPFIIDKIYSSHGQKYTEHTHEEAVQIMQPQTAYLITSMLQDTFKRRNAGNHTFKRKDLSGKTGTTNDHIDGWHAGYNRDIVTTTWIGFDEPKTLHEYAVKSSLPMWNYYMQAVLTNTPERPPIQPEGLVNVKIDPLTGLRAYYGQTDAIYELFTYDTVPKQYANPTASSALALDNTENLF